MNWYHFSQKKLHKMYFFLKKNPKMDIPLDLAIPPHLGIYSKEIDSDLHKNIDTKPTTEFFFSF